MKSNFARYKEEREGKEVLENEHGFATFLFEDDYVYVEDVYIIPESRQKGEASSFIYQIEDLAKDRDVFKVMVTVDVRTNGANQSILAILHHGFNVISSDKNVIYFIKEI